MRKILTALLVGCLLIGVMPLGASSISDKKNEINQTKKELQNVKEEIKETEAEKAKEEAALKKLDQEMIVMEEKVLKVETDLGSKQEEVKVVQEELVQATEKKEHQYQATKQRMVQMYKNSRSGYMELFFSSNSLSELLTRAKYINTISEYDNQLVDEYEKQEQVIAENEKKLAEEEEKLQGLYEQQVAAKSELESMRKKKNERIGILKNQSEELHDMAENFEDEYKQLEQELEKELARLQAQQQTTQVKYNGGKFAWPVPGHYNISSGYIHRTNPVTGRSEWHKGLDIPAPYGKAVVAAADGVVTTAGPVGSFGNTVMISHGSGITTIYAHNSSVTVSVGQTVTKGQQIAKIGSTGRSTGNHSHFEVRINNQHTSPWNYLSK